MSCSPGGAGSTTWRENKEVWGLGVFGKKEGKNCGDGSNEKSVRKHREILL